MNVLTLLFLCVFGATQFAMAAPTKLDPALNMAAQAPSISASMQKCLHLKATVTDRPLVAVFVKASAPSEVAKSIEQWGGTVRTYAGHILTADVPLADVAALSQLESVIYVEAAKPLLPRLNQTVPLVDGNDVTDSTLASAADLPQAYTGAGVIVGVVDSGLDCDHADWNDDAGDSRVLSYWDQTTGTSGVGELIGSSGTEYTGSTIADGSCTAANDDGSGHGTHVAGIAVSNDASYKGVAPAANLVAVKHNASDANSGGTFATMVIDAVNYIFRKAQAQSPKQAAVVNLSLGTSLGAHDGTSLFEQALDFLLVESGSTEKEGRAIINAAGNENFSTASSLADDYGGIHATISQTGTAVNAYDFNVGLSFPFTSASTVFATYGAVQVDIWLTADSNCTIQVDATDEDDKESVRIDMAPVSAGNSTLASANTDGNIQIALDFTDNENANNGKQHALATISRVSGGSSVNDYAYDLIFSGECTGDAWLYPDLLAATSFRKASALSVATHSAGHTYVSGDSLRTATIPSTANKVIAVGSFMGDPATYVDINNNTRDQIAVTGGVAGGISLFSSLGPTADGRVKPDLSAPGEPVVATLASTVSAASSNKGDATHQKIEGTSMAAPHVAGTVALMLERNGCLNATEIKEALIDTATRDSLTGDGLPDNAWGAGKLNVLEAVKAVEVSTCIPDNPSENASVTIGTGTDTSGGGGCALRLPW